MEKFLVSFSINERCARYTGVQYLHSMPAFVSETTLIPSVRACPVRLAVFRDEPLMTTILERSCHCDQWHTWCYSTAHGETICLPLSFLSFPITPVGQRNHGQSIPRRTASCTSASRHYEWKLARDAHLTKCRGKTRRAVDNLPFKMNCRSETPSNWTRIRITLHPSRHAADLGGGPCRFTRSASLCLPI